MGNNQSGYVLVLIFSLTLVLIWYFSAAIADTNDKYNRFVSDCSRESGVVIKTEAGILKSRYDCFVDGKQIVVPGWEVNND